MVFLSAISISVEEVNYDVVCGGVVEVERGGDGEVGGGSELVLFL
jgi:hypothetical protein